MKVIVAHASGSQIGSAEVLSLTAIYSLEPGDDADGCILEAQDRANEAFRLLSGGLRPTVAWTRLEEAER